MSDVTELAAAILNALEVPFEAHRADRETRDELNISRVAWIKSTLERLADDGDIDAAIRSARAAVDDYPVTYPVLGEQSDAEASPAGADVRRPAAVLCRHCRSEITRDYGPWQHTDTGREPCDEAGQEYATPDHPYLERYSVDLVGRRVTVHLKSGKDVTGTLTGSAGYTLTVKGHDGHHPDWVRDVRVETIAYLRPLDEQPGGGS